MMQNEKARMMCREARRHFAALDSHGIGSPMEAGSELTAAKRHIEECSECARGFRIIALQRATLDAAAAQDPIKPDEDFFRGLRARIARGPESVSVRPDESWTAALLLTSRQLIPAMAVLLLLIVGATLFWNQPSDVNQVALRPRERVVFSDMYDLPAPTRDDVLETLVAIEEKENGK